MRHTAMALGNDTRGWIMTALSGIACMFGASIICIDLPISRLPGWRKFKIQDSNTFLSASLSLSFGVMLYSSLYNLLPNSKTSLQKGGFSPQAASWIMISLFMAGAVGIQVVSRVAHHYIPHDVVDCDHTHADEEAQDPQRHHHDRHKNEASVNGPPWRIRGEYPQNQNCGTPNSSQMKPPASSTHCDEAFAQDILRRPSFTSKVSQLVSTQKETCDGDGQCHGYSDPCGVGCFKILRGGSRHSHPRHLHPPLSRSATAPRAGDGSYDHRPLLLRDVDEEYTPLLQDSSNSQPDRQQAEEASSNFFARSNGHNHKQRSHSHGSNSSQDRQHSTENAPSEHHHHHVPTNAFLSIGLQTSIAIALHKLPEGFITYATNHANPKLGFSVFLALFIHNITEGFAMALPLYLAINSRGKAMIWSALMGGVSQPAGAGVAAIWFKLAGSDGAEPGEGVYGGMFAIVAGIMASVALQLFSESLDLTHNKNLCLAFAFVGMGILGVSSALTA